jgi:hypothetical protein
VDEIHPREHRFAPENRTAGTTMHHGVLNLLCRDKVEPASAPGPLNALAHLAIRIPTNALFRNSDRTRVSVPRMSEIVDRHAFALDTRFADAWDEPHLVLRFKTRAPLPASRLEFYRRSLLSRLIRQIDFVALPLTLAQECDVAEALTRYPICNLRSETLEAQMLVREEVNHRPDTLHETIFAESPGSISVPLESIFRLSNPTVQDGQVVPVYREYLLKVALVVDMVKPRFHPEVELLSCGLTANRSLFAEPLLGKVRPEKWSDTDGEKSCSLSEIVDWFQMEAEVPAGNANATKRLSWEATPGWVQELVVFVRSGESDEFQPCYHRLKSVSLNFNHQELKWEEAELVERMAETGCQPSTAIYRVLFDLEEGANLQRIDLVEVKAEYWEPPRSDARFYVCIRSARQIHGFRLLERPDCIGPVSLV